MNKLLIDLKTLMTMAKFTGNLQSFKSSVDIVRICRKNKVIAKGLLPASLSKELRANYFAHLVDLATTYLVQHRDVRSWTDFCKHPSNRSVAKIFFEFGIKAEVFDVISELPDDNIEQKDTLRITEDELYELSRIRFNFKGSKTSFRRMIVEMYGSYAEYCIEKGYDINQTNWEDEETAIRCAKRLGGVNEVKRKSKSLFKYLSENGMLEKLKIVS